MRHFVDIFGRILLNGKYYILIKSLPNFGPKIPIDN